MVDYVKQDMTDIWASSGDITAPSSGKIATGWVVEAVPRQWWNWFENRQDTNIAYLLQKGIPEWDAVTEYQTNKSYVQRNNVVYKCIVGNVNFDPATQPTKWVKAFPESSASLEAIRVLTPAADRLAYFTSGSAAALATLTSFARTLLDDADAATARTTLAAQQSNVNLTALAGVTAATNTLPYWNSTTTMLGTNLTAFGRSILDDADATAGRATLGLGTAATATVTTSNTDTTAGRITKVGDFGENGGNPMALANTDDANLINVSGTYVFANGGINLPTVSSFYLKHIAHSVAGYAKQLAWNLTTATNYERTQVAGAWGGWLQSATTTDLSTALVPYALKGANSDITSLSGLTTALSVAQGGTGTTTSTGTGSTVRSIAPTFTGVPLAPTAAPGNNSTQIATTAYADAIAALKANIASPSLTGTPLAPTASPGTNTTQIATTAFVAALGALKANLASPALTGVPTAPTATAGTNTTQLATTAFVAALGALKQDALGYTPVQQGTGVGQLTNIVKIGWSAASKLKVTVDSTDLSNIALESWVNGLFQSTQTDTTSGKIMAVGAFGLGCFGPGIPTVSDINNTFNVGFYKFNGGVTGAPPQFAGAGGSLIVHSLGGNFVQQIAISIPGTQNNPMMCLRHYDTNGNPGSWVTMYTNANIVGTVSVSGTLPTGAIMETATNANGSYTKFTDGTLICQGPIADFNVGASANPTLTPNGTFAHPFVNSLYGCQGMGTPNTSHDHYGYTAVNNRATTAVNFVHRNGATAQIMVNNRYIAIGRWY